MGSRGKTGSLHAIDDQKYPVVDNFPINGA
jgi:RNase adaptor protein for sRNA GlmZ degradation